MLTLVATPIGNLEDITVRAVKALQEADLILCEDTRHSRPLLERYEVKSPTKSYHKFNEAGELHRLIALMKGGSRVCLISDAGTPAISDPGYLLVRECVKEGIAVDSLPGPCAAIVALTLSGLESEPFQYIGFLPKKQGLLKKSLLSLLLYPGTTICYESPHRLLQTLQAVAAIDEKRSLVVARELTKRFQEVVRGAPREVIAHFSGREIKGEIVLLLESGERYSADYWRGKPVEEAVAELEARFHLKKLEAVKLLASLRGENKRRLYKTIALQ